MNVKKTALTMMYLSVLFLISCASGHCRRNQEGRSAAGATPNEHVLVSKVDGSLQCNMGKGVALDEMAQELTKAGITVYSSENRHDGLMHIQACGTPTGQINVYEIADSDLPEALKLGFRELEQD